MLFGSAILLLMLVSSAHGHTADVAFRETFGAQLLYSNTEWSTSFQLQYLQAAERGLAIKRLIKQQSDNFVHLLVQLFDIKVSELQSMPHSHQDGQTSSSGESLHAVFNATMNIDNVLEAYYAVLKNAFEKCTELIFDAYMQANAARYAHLVAHSTQENANSEWCRWCTLEVELVKNSLFDTNIKYFAAYEHQLEALSHDMKAWVKINEFFYSSTAMNDYADIYTLHARHLADFMRMTKHQYLDATFRKLEMESYRNAAMLVLNQLELTLRQIQAQQA